MIGGRSRGLIHSCLIVSPMVRFRPSLYSMRKEEGRNHKKHSAAKPQPNRTPLDSMFSIAEAGYHARGGKDPHLPGRAAVTKGGRADARFSIDANGELYLYSKSDGMIRTVVGATGF